MGVSVANLKILTGGDPLGGAIGEPVKVSISCIFTSNVLPTPVEANTCIPECSRRFLVLRSKKRDIRTNHDVVAAVNVIRSCSDSARMAFVSECLKVRLMHEDMPHTIESLLHLLYMGRAPYLLSMFRGNPGASASTSTCATIALSYHRHVALEDLMNCVSSAAPHLVGTGPNGFYYIRTLESNVSSNLLSTYASHVRRRLYASMAL